jgi:uncharacterized glyoxalase superfamily protein PhnB
MSLSMRQKNALDNRSSEQRSILFNTRVPIGANLVPGSYFTASNHSQERVMATHELFAYLHIKDAAKAIDFYIEAFGAKEMFRLADPSGKVGHAQLDFDGTTLMLADEYPDMNIKGPQSIGGTSVTIHLHVDNADEVIQRAVNAGATLQMKPTDQFYGERSGSVIDPFGHRWNIGHSIEAVTPEEMQKRFAAMPS